MKLTQALGKGSLIVDGAEDNEIASNPDENGGFYLDTWDNMTIRILFSAIPKNERYNVRKVSECGTGVRICHKFTVEHCKKILEKLSTIEEKETEDGKAFFIDDNFDGRIFSEAFKDLIGIFSDFDDLPVYYWCD